jgi:hypothetical protein
VVVWVPGRADAGAARATGARAQQWLSVPAPLGPVPLECGTKKQKETREVRSASTASVLSEVPVRPCTPRRQRERSTGCQVSCKDENRYFNAQALTSDTERSSPVELHLLPANGRL